MTPADIAKKAREMTTIKEVDGDEVRKRGYQGFAMGGNHQVYPEFVPKGEVWVERSMSPKAKAETARHELNEEDAMSRGDSYDDAHQRAEKADEALSGGGQAKKASEPVPPYRASALTDYLLGGRKFEPRYLTGEVEEFHQALADKNHDEAHKELQDVMFAAQMSAYHHTGVDRDVLGADQKIKEFIDRRKVWRDMFKARGLTYDNKYIVNGSNWHKPDKIQKAFGEAGHDISLDDAVRLRDLHMVKTSADMSYRKRLALAEGAWNEFLDDPKTPEWVRFMERAPPERPGEPPALRAARAAHDKAITAWNDAIGELRALRIVGGTARDRAAALAPLKAYGVSPEFVEAHGVLGEDLEFARGMVPSKKAELSDLLGQQPPEMIADRARELLSRLPGRGSRVELDALGEAREELLDVLSGHSMSDARPERFGETDDDALRRGLSNIKVKKA